MKFDYLHIRDWDVLDPRLDTLIRHVIERIPERYTDQFQSFSVVEGHSPLGAFVDPVDNVMFLDASKLTACSERVAVGTISHELAHIFLCQTAEGGLKDDHAADELTMLWGFSEEITEMRRVIGQPTAE